MSRENDDNRVMYKRKEKKAEKQSLERNQEWLRISY